MTPNLTEGYSFPPGHHLDRKLSENPVWESWVCTNEKTGERFFARIGQADGPIDWQAQAKNIDAVRGLVHENVNLAHSHGQEGHLYFIIEPYLPGCEPFVGGGDNPWPILKQLLDVLIYIHQLDLCHGNIHPGNLLIDSQGHLKITGMGLYAQRSPEYSQFVSPQIRSGDTADATDDIYALGCLIYSSLTGKTFQSGGQPDAPVPDNLRPLIEQMMSSSVLDRNLSLLKIKETLTEHFEDTENRITVEAFARAQHSEAEIVQELPVVTRQARAISTQQVSFALTALVAIGVGLFTLLPQNSPTIQSPELPQTGPEPATAPTQAAQSPAPVEAGPTPFEAARLEHLQEEGETIARSILKLQLNLEDHGVFLWANERFTKLGEDLDNAENLFREGDYEAAMGAYTATRGFLLALQTEMPTRLAEEVTRGDAALGNGDHAVALTAFTIANAIARTDADIKAKVRRAENLNEVLRLVRRAELEEREANYSAALDIFMTARDLDNLWQPTADGVGRMQRAIRMRQFQNAMSEAFQAIARKQYQAARNHFNQAQSILPESKEPADGLAQVAQAETNDAINDKRDEAEAFVAEEDWQQAITSYEAAIAISDSLAFAKEGLEYANWRLNLDKQLTKYLSDPPLLQSNAELQAASGIVKEASGILPAGADLQRQIDSLAKLISTARIQIPVTIRSNGKTSVTVRKRANLGNIDAEMIYLIPGRYTITGERPGYRDVREELVLIAGRPVPDIFVASTERVR